MKGYIQDDKNIIHLPRQHLNIALKMLIFPRESDIENINLQRIYRESKNEEFLVQKENLIFGH